MLKNIVIIVVGFILTTSVSAIEENTPYAQRTLKLVASHYQLDYQLDYSQKTLTASGTIRVKNVSDSPANHIPLRLYRMLAVSDIEVAGQKSTRYQQQILADEAWPVLQTNYVEVELEEALVPGEEISFSLSFSGSLRGYVETGMNYVKDSIDENFSIIRMDAFAYPIISYPNDSVNRNARFWLHRYDYDVAITVNKQYRVANGGELIETSESGDLKRFRFKNKLPAWRMDFAIAQYTQYQQGLNSVYSWESEKLSRQLLERMEQTFNLYSKWFGPLQNSLGYTFIEVPENYGAQADVTAVIQDAAGFTELNRMYHEISHQWNVKTLDSHSPRWNEGLASFLEVYTHDVLSDQNTLPASMDASVERFKKLLENNPAYATTAFIDYGTQGLNAYVVGKIFFKLLFDRLGQDNFNQIIGGFYRRYYSTGASTETFVKYLESHAKTDISALLDDWVNSADFANIIKNSDDYSALLNYYR